MDGTKGAVKFVGLGLIEDTDGLSVVVDGAALALTGTDVGVSEFKLGAAVGTLIAMKMCMQNVR